jgi:hypothetical protein
LLPIGINTPRSTGELLPVSNRNLNSMDTDPHQAFL